MVISKGRKIMYLAEYLIYTVLCVFNFAVIYALFLPNSNSQSFKVNKKIIDSKSAEDPYKREPMR